MSGSNRCFLTCIQVSQEPGKVVWISHLSKNFPQFVVIHTVKGFSVVSETEVDGFLEFPCSARSQTMSLLTQNLPVVSPSLWVKALKALTHCTRLALTLPPVTHPSRSFCSGLLSPPCCSSNSHSRVFGLSAGTFFPQISRGPTPSSPVSPGWHAPSSKALPDHLFVKVCPSHSTFPPSLPNLPSPRACYLWAHSNLLCLLIF